MIYLNNALTKEISAHWPTPILQKLYDQNTDVIEELRIIVLNKESESKHKNSKYHIQLSNIGSWRSNTDLLKWKYPAIEVLKEWISESIFNIMDFCTHRIDNVKYNEITIEAWANIYRKNSFHMPHVHHNSMWSGVFFLSDLEKQNNNNFGILEFYDPRNQSFNKEHSKNLTQGNLLKIIPKAGLLVIFPSWLMHYVTPYHGDERISIAFNASIQ